MIFQKTGNADTALHTCRSSLAEASAGKERHSLMKRFAKAMLPAFCTLMLLAGCGADTGRTAQDAHRAETSARPAATAGADEHNSLYERDDVHRETDVTEPDILDRAETAVSKAGDKAKELVTEAKNMMSDAKADMTATSVN